MSISDYLLKSSAMERKRNIIQVYSIVVNVIAIITFLIASTSFIGALIDRNDPIYGGYSQVDVSSFEKYKMDVMKSTTEDGAYIPTDEEIRTMFEAAKADKINKVMHESFKTMLVSGIIIGVCVIMFAVHWMLMKKQSAHPQL